MLYCALNEEATAAAADAVRAWSEVADAWSRLLTSPFGAAPLDAWASIVRAGEVAQLASLRAAFVAVAGAHWEVTPFGVTGAFCSTAPGQTTERAKVGAPGGETAAAPAPQRAFQALAKPLGRADDLTRIRGVGPRIQEKLNALGVFHFWQLASLSKTEAERLDAALAANGRVVREGWVAQARRLAADVPA